MESRGDYERENNENDWDGCGGKTVVRTGTGRHGDDDEDDGASMMRYGTGGGEYDEDEDGGAVVCE